MPRVLLVVGGGALVAAIVSIAVGEGGPQAEEIGGVNEVQRIFGGIAQEGAELGSEDADTVVSVFNDIQCEPCAAYEIDVIDPLVEEYARTGEARFEFRHFSLAPNDTTVAAIAAEAAGEQARQWQYLATFVRNQEVAISRDVDEEVLREIAEAVPQLEVDQWLEDFASPRSEELVREDAMLAAELELPADPAVVVSGRGGQRELIESPTGAQIESAIAEVGR
ncbi:MAG: DsbA family protein [Solirubrobacterales bacterium]